MGEKFNYEFKKSIEILFKYYYGFITLTDIESSWEYAFKKNLIPKETKGFILDYRNATFKIELEEHDKIADFYKKNLDIFGNFKIAIITEDPKDSVIPILVRKRDDGYHSRLFSTVDAAIHWVLA